MRTLLQDWPLSPENDARIFRDEDGRQIIRVCTPEDIERLELPGRPDSTRPHGMQLALEYHLERLASSKAAGSRVAIAGEFGRFGHAWRKNRGCFHPRCHPNRAPFPKTSVFGHRLNWPQRPLLPFLPANEPATVAVDFQTECSDVWSQYRGTLGSISSDHALMPPLTLFTYLNPLLLRNVTALRERAPLLQRR